jgi:polyhydroxyalkanoate synthesis regulator phasin
MIQTLITIAPYIGTVGAFLIGAYKDQILLKLNLKKQEKEIDTVYITNSERLVEIYSKSMTDLLERNETTLNSIEEKHQRDLEAIRNQFDIEREKDATRDAKREERLNKSIESEKKLHETVEDLRGEVEKLTQLVTKLTNQLKYYEEHSDIELPSDLKD